MSLLLLSHSRPGVGTLIFFNRKLRVRSKGLPVAIATEPQGVMASVSTVVCFSYLLVMHTPFSGPFGCLILVSNI